MSVPDPRHEVEAPVRREIAWIIGRGLALVAVIAALAACPLLFACDVATRDGFAMAAPLVLIAYALTVHTRRLTHGGPPDDARAEAWARASEVDPDDAALGRLISSWVPLGLLLALGVLVWPHFTDANPALACAWVVLGLPPIAVAWGIACSTWLDACRDDLARAEGESDALFRRYWANVGR